MEEWQRRMVDPNWGGGKFGHRGIGGEGLILSALPGMGYRGALRNLWARNARANRSRIPSFQSPAGGTVFRGQRFGKDATLNDLRANFARPHGAVRPTRGVRPYRGPRGIGLYKGTRTGPVNPPVEKALNPVQRAAQWWRYNNPWM